VPDELRPDVPDAAEKLLAAARPAARGPASEADAQAGSQENRERRGTSGTGPQGQTTNVAVSLQVQEGRQPPSRPATVQSAPQTTESAASPGELTEEEEALVRELRARDREVRAHEAAHATTGGGHAGAPQFEYVRGPDGVQYAVAGKVEISTSPVPNDPEATIAKMEAVRAAALAPARPSGQDRAVAAAAEQAILKAQAALRAEQAEEAEREEEADTLAGRNVGQSADQSAGAAAADTSGVPADSPGVAPSVPFAGSPAGDGSRAENTAGISQPFTGPGRISVDLIA
jgi:hypothetical protein